jgi:hypothetical protein
MILGTSRAVRVYAYPEAVDLRKGYDGLFGLVKQGLSRDPLSGDLFLFVSQRRRGCKVLLWDGTGLCIFQNNATERGIRGPVVGCKNHYGSKSRRGTAVAATFYTLLETAKLAGIDPAQYLREAALADARGEVLMPT